MLSTQTDLRLDKVRSRIERDPTCLFYREYNIPLRFRCKTFGNLQLENKNTYKNSLINGNSLFITGDVGVGKTHLAIALAIEYFLANLSFTNGITVKNKIINFLPASELFIALKATFDNRETERDILDFYSTSDLLILDDLGSNNISEWAKQIIYTIIDRSYRNMKAVIITSNLSLDEFAVAYDDRIASRLVEMGEIIRLKGKDKRK